MYPHERSLVNDMQGRPFALLGVNNDAKLSRVKKAIRENDLNWRSWYDGKRGPIVRSFGVSSFPTIFLIDHNGVIRYKNLRGKKLDRAIEELVAEAEGAGMAGEIVQRTPKYRTFKDSSGEYSIFAVFKAYSNGNVTLEQKNGNTVTVALSKLSRKDQDHLRRGGFLVEQAITVANTAKPSLRLFVDSTGEYKIRATLIEFANGQATLQKENGQSITVPIEKLSDTDQKYILEMTSPDSG